MKKLLASVLVTGLFALGCGSETSTTHSGRTGPPGGGPMKSPNVPSADRPPDTKLEDTKKETKKETGKKETKKEDETKKGNGQ